MNYIYDIILNFNEEIYDFYDWNQNDVIYHIRRIPFYKVNSIMLHDVKNSIIKFDQSFLKEINNKTEIFTNKGIRNLEYSFLLTDGLEVIGIFLTNKKLKYSKLLIDEELECLEMTNRIKEKNIEYEIIKIKEKKQFKTRKEMEISRYINEELNKLYKENNLDKLKYLYYECYDEQINDTDNINKLFEKKFENEKKVYDILKLIQNNK